MSNRSRRILLIIALLAVAGVAVSSLSLAHHYAKSKSSYCDFGETFNCDMVNRSVYSVVMGVPVALIGVVGYLALLALATVYRAKAETPVMLFIAALAGLAFALYLTYVEAFVLVVWCILCLSSLTLIFAITMLSSILFVYSRRSA
ncbi:MAG TPA: vitamin K epoxide reductase family protein [Terriglobales bacterium]|nr:vitamin K epoxide reductase family protein [Terriglobales bacterium]